MWEQFYFSILIAGFGGGMVRALFGFFKQFSYKTPKFETLYFFVMVFISGIIGLLTAVVIKELGLNFFGLGEFTPALAFIVGYAGGDFLESVYKIVLKKTSIFEAPAILVKNFGKEMKFMLNKYYKIIFVLVILASGFLFAKSASAATFYVRPSVTDGSCTYGTCNGTSYANAWEGFSGGDGTPINWTTVDGDNSNTILFICGTHAQTLTPSYVGESSAPIKIYSCETQYGASTNDPGVIDVASGAAHAIWGWNSPYLSYMEFKGLTLSNSTSNLFGAYSSTGLKIENMTFNGGVTSAVELHTDTSVTADNLTINNTSGIGVNLTNPVSSNYSNITTNTSTGKGFRASGNVSSTGNTFSYITINNPTGNGVEFTNFSTASITADHITVNNAHGLNVNLGAIHITNTSGVLTNATVDGTQDGVGIYFNGNNSASNSFTMGLSGVQASKDIKAINGNYGRSISFQSVAEAADVTLQNFESSYNQSDPNTTSVEAVLFENSDGITIRNGWVHHNIQGLYFAAGADNNTVQNVISEYNTIDQLKSSFTSQGNIFANCIARYGGDGWVAAWQTATGRTAYGDHGIGVAFHVTAGNSTPNQIRDSLIYGNEGPGVEMANNTVSYVLNNVISQNGYSPGLLGLKGGIEMYSTAIANSRIQNNIFYDNSPAEIYHATPNPTTTYLAVLNVLDYNLYYHPDDSNHFYVDMTNDNTFNPGYKTWAQYYAAMAALGTPQETHSQYGDPLFTNVSTSDFTLQDSSPAINAGTNVALTSDYIGTAVPQGSAPDVGAYEYLLPSAAPTISTPSALSTTSLRWAFTDNATNETGFKVYDSTDTLASSSATTNLSYLDETGLSANTQYNGRYVTAYNSAGDSAHSATASSIYTKIESPTGVSWDSISVNAITLSASGTLSNLTSGTSGLYFANTTTSTNSGWTQTNSWASGSLSKNTQYTFQATSRNGDSLANTAVDLGSKYTLADTPTNLSASSNSNSVTLSVDSFPNDTSGQSGYYFSRSGANSGWIQTNSWTDTGLSCGHSYDYSVIYRNGDGTETSSISTTKSTSGCGGGGMPAGWSNLPITPTGGFKVSINSGASTTTNRIVNLSFNAGSDVKKMAISLTGDFNDASQENYSPTKQIDICSKFGVIKNPTCPDGTYKVYVKFYTYYGQSSGIASSTIILKSGSTPTENLQPTNNLPFTNPFTKYLQYRQTNADIKRLQIFLNSDPDTKVADSGAGSPGKETNYFGILTYKAVIKFQEKYAKDILDPWGFKKGTGYVGKTTLAKINELMKNK